MCIKSGFAGSNVPSSHGGFFKRPGGGQPMTDRAGDCPFEYYAGLRLLG